MLEIPLYYSDPQQVSADVLHSCALDNLGIYCWGLNNVGQTEVLGKTILTNPTFVDAGWKHSCAINEDRVICWGDNSSGQLLSPGL